MGLLALAVSLLFSTPAPAAADRAREVDRIFDWAKPGSPGCVVAASQHGKPILQRAYGSADLERDVPLSADSIFDVGSVVKQFVAASTLLLVEEGRLSLSEDVRSYIPELPDTGHKVTLDHLLTHTSGVREWQEIASAGRGNEDALTMVLRQRGLNFAPGEEWSYSNSGYVLLKEIVARKSGMPFTDFTRARLFEPLGMKSTRYILNMRDVVKGRALAYEKQGDRWHLNMLLDNDRGGGGALLSTAGDLLLWNDALTNGRLGSFVTRKLQEPARLNNGRKLGYARALFPDAYRGFNRLWHSGGAAGYRTWLGRYPDNGLSLAVLCNSREVAATAMAEAVADKLLPASAPKVAPTPVPMRFAAMLDSDVGAKAGLFFNERTGQPLRLLAEKGELRIQGARAPLTLLSGNRFRNAGPDLRFMSQDAFELKFLSRDRFETTSMEGATTPYRRAAAYSPTSSELRAFAGRYGSEEMGSIFQVLLGPKGLLIRPEHAPKQRAELQPVDRDTFQHERTMLRFRRDGRGRIVSFHYSTPLLRNVEFARLSDR